MEIDQFMSRYPLIAACIAMAAGYGALTLAAESEAPAQTPPAQPAGNAAAPAQAFSVKNTFRNVCGFCHESYGRKAGKGPQLMGSQLSDQQIFDRIKNGKPGRMAAFGGSFTDDQIREIVVFIRALRPDVDP
jgi:mono/diheme cytochrome c family protein